MREKEEKEYYGKKKKNVKNVDRKKEWKKEKIKSILKLLGTVMFFNDVNIRYPLLPTHPINK